MIEQQYRVIADRDKGDDMSWHDVEEGDRHTSIKSGGPYPDPLMRIERPVSTNVEPDDLRAFVLDELNGQIDSLDETVTQEDMGRVLLELRDSVRDGTWRSASSTPTREQIEKVVTRWRRDLDTGTGPELEDRLVALFQNGANE